MIIITRNDSFRLKYKIFLANFFIITVLEIVVLEVMLCFLSNCLCRLLCQVGEDECLNVQVRK